MVETVVDEACQGERPAVGSSSAPGRPRLVAGVRGYVPAWTVEAWMSIGVVATFLGITLWWLDVDRSIPVFDAGVRLSQAIFVYEHLRAGAIGRALTVTTPYPPFAYLVGALGLWVGGRGVAGPVIAENFVFVPLLALGCYRVGRMAFGARAGLLAVVFALGTPLLAAQFHVFMVDAPETAMVAVSVWLILASERFSRTWVSALAGVSVGLGMLTKEPFVFFVSGVVLVSLVRGGWRSWRGVAAFLIAAGALALPWYFNDFAQVHGLAQASLHGGAPSANGIAPPPLSISNLLWYFWNIVNAQLYAPLFALALIGAAWTIQGLLRRRPVSRFAWELAAGGFVAWLGITETFVHDIRYGMPLLLYLAVFGSGWIANLRRPAVSAAAIGALVVFAAANTLGDSFGVGRGLLVKLPGAEPAQMQGPGLVRIYSNSGFMVSAPERDGDILGLMRALRAHGIEQIAWTDLGPHEPSPGLNPGFSQAGLRAFATIAGLSVPPESEPFANLTAQAAVLGHGPLAGESSPPCARLGDGTGVWVRLGNPDAPHAQDYCPFRHPESY